MSINVESRMYTYSYKQFDIQNFANKMTDIDIY
jgi:hypothetical protein